MPSFSSSETFKGIRADTTDSVSGLSIDRDIALSGENDAKGAKKGNTELVWVIQVKHFNVHT